MLAEEPAANQGYAVAREYYKLDGSKADLSKVKQNDRLVVVLKITEPEAKYARLLIVDPLPAGLEIDNPKLMDADQLSAARLAEAGRVALDGGISRRPFRRRRRSIAGPPASFAFAYMVRAVSSGHYVHPPTTVEDMYRPERYGRAASGSLVVAPAKSGWEWWEGRVLDEARPRSFCRLAGSGACGHSRKEAQTASPSRRQPCAFALARGCRRLWRLARDRRARACSLAFG